VLWGVILVGLYMAAYESLANISAPLAMLNIVTFVSIRFTRTFYFAQVGVLACSQSISKMLRALQVTACHSTRLLAICK
jgi:hypothetical protein